MASTNFTQKNDKSTFIDVVSHYSTNVFCVNLLFFKGIQITPGDTHLLETSIIIVFGGNMVDF